MLKKLPRTAMVLGILVGFGGVVLVSLPSVTAESEDKTQATGVALVLLATLCYGVSVNIATPIQQKYGSLPVMVRMLAPPVMFDGCSNHLICDHAFCFGPKARRCTGICLFNRLIKKDRIRRRIAS